MNGIQIFNESMAEALISNKRFLLKRPAYIKTFAKFSSRMKKQAKLRESLSVKEDLVVPPVLIVSVTNDCNLSCKGCYACVQNRDRSQELSIERTAEIIDDAVSLGVSVIMIAGGEPLIKPRILSLPEKHPDILYVMFTNGILLGAEKELPLNFVPVISLEGGRDSTNTRRGEGMYERVMEIMMRLDISGRLFGASITLTSENYKEVINAGFLDSLEAAGCRAAFLIEYVPSGDDDIELCLTEEQKQELRENEDRLYRKYDMLIVTLPGDEEKYGGCLAAGRGFVHISSTGALEACPFAPYSDISVKDTPLKEALKSRLLRHIRDNHHLLKESRGGCTLRENKEWLDSLNSSSQITAND